MVMVLALVFQVTSYGIIIKKYVRNKVSVGKLVHHSDILTGDYNTYLLFVSKPISLFLQRQISAMMPAKEF